MIRFVRVTFKENGKEMGCVGKLNNTQLTEKFVYNAGQIYE